MTGMTGVTGVRPVRLGRDALDALPPEVGRPRYDRSALTVGIVHIGVGGFHRSHQARYVERLLDAGLGAGWGICGVGLLPGDARMAEVLDAQDGLYTVVEKAGDGSLQARLVGSIVRYLYAPDDPEAVLEQLADPAVRIVSLTVTEGGYALDPGTEEFDPADPVVAPDLTGTGPPRTVFGYVVEALRRRRDRGLPAFTLMSCDNIPGNGHVAARAFGAYARLVDAELAGWIAAHVRFPSSMVDRITPMTTPLDVVLVRQRLGIEDGWPVVCEPFTQWVLEDSFADGRPPLAEAGVQLTWPPTPASATGTSRPWPPCTSTASGARSRTSSRPDRRPYRRVRPARMPAGTSVSVPSGSTRDGPEDG